MTIYNQYKQLMTDGEGVITIKHNARISSVRLSYSYAEQSYSKDFSSDLLQGENIPTITASLGDDITNFFYEKDAKLFLDEAKLEYDFDSGTLKMPKNMQTGTFTLLDGTKKLCIVKVVKQKIRQHKPLLVKVLNGDSFMVPTNTSVSVSAFCTNNIVNTMQYIQFT